MLTRRIFLRGSAVVMAGLGSAPAWLARAAGEEGKKRKVLVAIFQRGAADGLNIVIPFGDKAYYDLRPGIGILPPSGQRPVNSGPGGYVGPGGPNAIDLDGKFGLNPALEPLKGLWEKKQLAVIEATGSPDPSRSHFDAQDYMESGTPGKTSTDGWMNRALLPAGEHTSPLRAIGIGPTLARTLRGERSAIAVSNAQTFQMGNSDTAGILEDMYERSRDSRLEHTGRDAFSAMKMVQSISNQYYQPANGAQYYQGGELGQSLLQVARLIKANVGVEAAFAEVGGWDHHGNEPQQLSNLLRQYGAALNAFAVDMGDRMEDIVLVTMSEFGRTAHENGDSGTDHGHGSVMFVMGGPVRGGKVYGSWPGLEKEQLYEGRDLAVTTDFRAVLSELVSDHMGQKDISQVFPGYTPGKPLGLLKT